jgi:hypothetical protein
VASLVRVAGSGSVQPGQDLGMTKAVPPLLALALLAACGKAASGGSTAGKTVVKGTVFLSPSSPVCRIGSPCSKPLPHFRFVFSQHGRAAARVITDSRGRYRVSLRPGLYAVATGRRGALQPRRVRVRATGATVNFNFDAGIR